MTDAVADRIVFDGRRASGVRIQRDRKMQTIRVRREVILSTGAVAEEAGYQSEAAFNRIFKQKTGQTPAAYRRSLIS